MQFGTGQSPRLQFGHLASYLVIGAILMGCLWLWNAPFGPLPAGKSNGAIPPHLESREKEANTPTAESIERVTATSLHKQELAAAKFNQKQALEAYADLVNTFSEWEGELETWDKEFLPLMNNAEGRRIAGDERQVKRFRTLHRLERPTKAALVSAHESAEKLIAVIQDASNDPADASSPPSSITDAMRTLHKQAETARNSLHEANTALRSMIADVKEAQPADSSLEQTIIALDQHETGQRLSVIDAAVKQAEDEAAERIAKAKAKLVKETADAEVSRLANEATLKKQATELANAQTIQEMAVAQKAAASRIAEMEDAAEQTRIGNLKSGSKWKGGFNFSGYPPDPTIFTIQVRAKDNVTGDARYGNGSVIFTFDGKVVGTKLKLKVLNISGFANQTFDLLYQPTTKTISGNMLTSGGQPAGSLNVQLMEEKDE